MTEHMQQTEVRVRVTVAAPIERAFLLLAVAALVLGVAS